MKCIRNLCNTFENDSNYYCMCTQDCIYLEVVVLIIIWCITLCSVVLGIVFGPESSYRNFYGLWFFSRKKVFRCCRYKYNNETLFGKITINIIFLMKHRGYFIYSVHYGCVVLLQFFVHFYRPQPFVTAARTVIT